MVANTCVEATARCGAELGYHVTLVRDATAAFSPEAMHAAHEINGPTFAHAILTTDAVIAALIEGVSCALHESSYANSCNRLFASSQIGRLETFGETAVNRAQQLARLRSSILISP